MMTTDLLGRPRWSDRRGAATAVEFTVAMLGALRRPGQV